MSRSRVRGTGACFGPAAASSLALGRGVRLRRTRGMRAQIYQEGGSPWSNGLMGGKRCELWFGMYLFLLSTRGVCGRAACSQRLANHDQMESRARSHRLSIVHLAAVAGHWDWPRCQAVASGSRGCGGGRRAWGFLCRKAGVNWPAESSPPRGGRLPAGWGRWLAWQPAVGVEETELRESRARGRIEQQPSRGEKKKYEGRKEAKDAETEQPA